MKLRLNIHTHTTTSHSNQEQYLRTYEQEGNRMKKQILTVTDIHISDSHANRRNDLTDRNDFQHSSSFSQDTQKLVVNVIVCH